MCTLFQDTYLNMCMHVGTHCYRHWHAHTYTLSQTHMHALWHAHTFTHTFACTGTHTHALSQTHGHACTHSHRHACATVCVHTHTRMHTHAQTLFQVMLEEWERQSPHWPGSFRQSVQTFFAPNFSLLVVFTYFDRMYTLPVLLWLCLLCNDAHFWLLCRPMDMMSIKKNIENGSIRTTAEFQRDMMLMFTNAIMYNSSNHDVYSMAKEMYDDVMVHIEVRHFSGSGYILLPCSSGSGSCLSCSLSLGLATFFPIWQFSVYLFVFCSTLMSWILKHAPPPPPH